MKNGWRVLSALALTAVLFGGWTATASAGGTPVRNFTATIAPDSVAAGQEADFSLTITNLETSNQPIRSVTVEVPSEFTVVDPPAPTATGGTKTTPNPPGPPIVGPGTWDIDGTYTITPDGPTTLEPGQSLVLTFTAEATCPIEPGPYEFTTAAFQDDDPTDADAGPFTLDGPQPVVTVTGACEVVCVYPQGDWKNMEEWPVDSLMLGDVEYDEAELRSILEQAAGGDALNILATQLIAAKLNAANGAFVPEEVADAIEAADELIGELIVKPVLGFTEVAANSELGQEMEVQKDILDGYNNGEYEGAPLCEPEE
jgi:hypothetical protein